MTKKNTRFASWLGVSAALASLLSCGCATESLDESLETDAVQGADGVVTKSFVQKNDHFGAAPGTFKQRYFVYRAPGARADGPVFFLLGNENRVTTAFLSGTSLKLLADSFQGTAITLEHRFYGDSIPGGTLSNANLKWLSMEQALEDDRSFQQAMMDAGMRGPWVAVGSSYAGNLAAYYRAKFPDLVRGAVVSSAPLDGNVLSSTMDAFTATHLPDACLKSFQAQIGYLESVALKDANKRRSLLATLGASTLKDDRTLLMRASDLMTGMMQRGQESSACATLEAAPNEAQGLLGLLKTSAPSTGFVAGTLEGIAALPVRGTETDNLRPWYYQACTQFAGSFPLGSAKASERLTSLAVDRSYYEGICRASYGVALNRGDNVEFKALREKIRSGQDLNMLMLNGLGDPWSSLSVLSERPAAGQTVRNSPTGRHGAGMGPPFLADPKTQAGLRAMQDQLRGTVAVWLGVKAP